MILNRAMLVAAALLLGSWAIALAHDTWFLPASHRVKVGQSVRLSLTSGMFFPADDFAIDPARVRRADVRLSHSTTALASGSPATQALRYTWTPRAEGVATLAAELRPKVLTLKPELVPEYFDEINADSALRNGWTRARLKQWRESYTKYAKAFVRVGAPLRDSSWAQPMGLTLELVPQRDPTALQAGDTLVVLVLRNGTPVPNFSVGAIGSGETVAHFARTDFEGRAHVPFPRAGLWLLNGTLLRRSARSGLEWESDFTTLTLAVAARTTPR